MKANLRISTATMKRTAETMGRTRSSAKNARGSEGFFFDPARRRVWKPVTDQSNAPVVYWYHHTQGLGYSIYEASRMSREQRVKDNWALLYAMEEARKTSSPLAVAFNLAEANSGAAARSFGFMIRGLKLLEPKLKDLNVPFYLMEGPPGNNFSKLLSDSKARLLVMDFMPLRFAKAWKQAVADSINCGLVEVDAHNVVPVWVASDKKEHAAYTIRPKINSRLQEFLTDFPSPVQMEQDWPIDVPPIDWDGILQKFLTKGAEVPEVNWARPGEEAAQVALQDFLKPGRLGKYATKRNDPTMPEAQSGLSPYLHFGVLAPQRAAWEATKLRSKHKESVDQFIEELVVRRELSDNYCYYEPNYDSFEAAAEWAKTSLLEHASDPRQYLYTMEQLEKGATHEDLWNACQKELVHLGKLHGYMRMYWAKKILEWTESPAKAIEIAIYLNDKYSLDGVDPNGYVGVMWSICAIHDRAFKERDITGKIRPMSYAGCKRKFDIPEYIGRVNRLALGYSLKFN